MEDRHIGKWMCEQMVWGTDKHGRMDGTASRRTDAWTLSIASSKVKTKTLPKARLTMRCNFGASCIISSLKKEKNCLRCPKKVDFVQNCMRNSFFKVSGPYKAAFRNAPKKTAKNGHFWVFLEKISTSMRSQNLKLVIRYSSYCKRLKHKESWWWV